MDENANRPRTLNEAQTRKELIGPRLHAAGWNVTPFVSGRSLTDYDLCAIEEYPTSSGPADYALCAGGKVIAVVEAKKRSLAPQGVLAQAERYARDLTGAAFDFGGLGAPFLYATNGDVIWHQDVRHPLSRSRKVAGFHTPEALLERLEGRNFETSIQSLLALPDTHPQLRYYQKEANSAVEQAITDRKRTMLLAMATGTGKTVTLVNQIYRLMKTGVAKRVLFLVDRRALAAQAVRTFASFEAEPGFKFDKVYEVYSQRFKREDLGDTSFDPNVLPASYLLEPKAGHAFVYVSTIQRMTVNLFGQQAGLSPEDEEADEDIQQLDIPIHAFDLIVADECHRGYSASELSIWRRTLEHFDAVKIGLTATPAAHTTAYFKNVVYRYGFNRAVMDGFLVDYDEVRLKSGVRMDGVFLDEGAYVGVVDPETGVEEADLLEDERRYDMSDVEAKVTAPDSNLKILEEIKKYADEHERRHGRFPKTLIFAVNDLPHTSHADQLVDTARDVFGRGDAFVQKITGRVDRPLQHIREFRNRQNPGVVVTVDMLSTGVDIPDLEFVVFLRPVKSRILFEQMMGRGTRKGERHPDKSHFVVFDCFGGTLLEYFKGATGITAELPRKQRRSLDELVEDIWQNRDRDYAVRSLVKRLQRIDKEMSGDARDLFAAYVPDGGLGGWASSLPQCLEDDFTAAMKLLRDARFQDLLKNYPRPKRSFLVAYETEDAVSSERLIHDAQGNAYRPDDYLTAFGQFVRDNAEQVEAIRVLLDQPRNWGVEALSELRAKLAGAYNLDALQKAHELHYKKALVDIISMVKRAAQDEAPLYTAEERVTIAFEKVTADREFTPEQEAWLGRIREHLVSNLSIEQDDFRDLPIFTFAGGLGKARRVFGDALPDLIQAFNEAIAA